MQTLVSSESYRDGGEARPCRVGALVMRVTWADGRVTETVCRDYGAAYDVIGGNAHPYTRWEILGEPWVYVSPFARWARTSGRRKK